MKKEIFIKMVFILMVSSLLLQAQEKNIINYSFQDNSAAVSLQQEIRLNMLVGKAVVGAAGSGSYLIRSSSFLNLRQQEKNEFISGEKDLPVSYALGQNYPNPFNPETRIRYSVPQEAYVSIAVYNMLGEKVQQLVDETRSQGTYTIQWDASGFTSGIYLYTMKSGSYSESKKLILLR